MFLIFLSSKSLEANCFLAAASKSEPPLLVMTGTSIFRSSANLPTRKDLIGKKNILELEDKFISRSMFKKLSAKQFNEYQEKVNLYLLMI